MISHCHINSCIDCHNLDMIAFLLIEHLVHHGRYATVRVNPIPSMQQVV
jgi:hypothetical protein